MSLTNNERLAVLETQMANVTRTQTEINGKLDDLLALRNKGVGAFWLASGLMGIVLSGFVTTFLGWMRHG